MSALTKQLLKAAEQHKGTDIGGLLQWAVLHIDEQAEALADTRQELEDEQNERIRLENAANTAAGQIESALAAIRYSLPVNVDHIGRDMCGHINLMAAQGDPDYLMPNGMSVRHIDLREKKPRKAKART